jgi:hypothetical protein
MLGDELEDVALQAKDRGIRRTAEARCALGQDVHHGLDVGRRTRYDLQDLARRRLLLQRLFRLVEEAHVLDGDDRLGGEGLEQRDVLGRERLRLASADGSPDPSKEGGVRR